MGLMDRVKQLVGQHSQKVERGIDEAAQQAGGRTGGQYSERINKAAGQAKERLGTDDEEGANGRKEDGPEGDQQQR